jgi:hypothetical protein
MVGLGAVGCCRADGPDDARGIPGETGTRRPDRLRRHGRRAGGSRSSSPVEPLRVGPIHLQRIGGGGGGPRALRRRLAGAAARRGQTWRANPTHRLGRRGNRSSGSVRALDGCCLWNRRAFTSSGPVANPPEPSERLEDVRPREASDAPGSSSGRVSARTTRAEGRQVRLTLHEAMKLVLSESGAGWMSAHALGRAISARGLYARGDGDIVRSGQIRARAAKYPHLFEGSRDGSNQVRLRRDA